MNKYWFKLKLTPNSTAWLQQVYFADTIELAIEEIIRIYGNIEYQNFTP